MGTGNEAAFLVEALRHSLPDFAIYRRDTDESASVSRWRRWHAQGHGADLPVAIAGDSRLGRSLGRVRREGAPLDQPHPDHEGLTLTLIGLPDDHVLVRVEAVAPPEATVREGIYRTIFEQSPLGKIIYRFDDPHDPAGFRTEAANAASVEATGVDVRRDVGRPLGESAPGFGESELVEPFRHTAVTGEPTSWEINYGDARYQPRWYASDLYKIDDERVCLVFRDISDRKALEAKLADHAASLTESNAQLEQFAYVASHDLQEPLRTLRSFSELLGERYADAFDERGERYLHYITDASARMQALVDGLLRFSRVERLGAAFRDVRLSEILDDVRRDLGAALAAEGAVLERPEADPLLHGDRAQLASVFQNLIQNALKYRAEAAPHITLTVGGAPDAGLTESSDRVVVRVRDNGIGIPPEQAERVFLMFQRLHARDDRPGLGLGLALVRRIVERHGGQIHCRPVADGPGALFEFTLPLATGVDDP